MLPSVLVRRGEWQQALNLFEAMLKGRVNPDIIVYNAAISACEKGGQWQQALNLFRAMPKAKAIPDSISYNAAISACEKGSQWQQALNLFEAVLRAKGTPTVISHNAAISACHRGHQWQQALLLFEAMPRSTVKPNRVTFCAESRLKILADRSFSMACCQFYRNQQLFKILKLTSMNTQKEQLDSHCSGGCPRQSLSAWKSATSWTASWSPAMGSHEKPGGRQTFKRLSWTC